MFRNISAENLFSWEALNYDVKGGISQIVGFNFDDASSEGCGKSAVPNILCWVLYGRIPKDVRIDEVIREGQSSGFGCVTLTSGHQIYRSRHPNILKINCPDGSSRQGKDAKETQAFINALIGLDFDAFCQSIYFAQNYPKRFVSSNETEKAAILSQVQDLSIFDRARRKAAELQKNTEVELVTSEKELAALEAKEKGLKSNLSLLADFIERFEADRAAKVKNLNEDKARYTGRLKTSEADLTAIGSEKKLRTQIAELEKRRDGLTEQATEWRIAIRDRRRREIEHEKVSRDLDHLEQSKDVLLAKTAAFNDSTETCPTCGSEVSAHSKEKILKERERLEGELALVSQRIKGCLQELSIPIPNSDDLEKALANADREEKTLRQQISVCQEKIVAIGRLESQIQETKARTHETSRQIEALQEAKPEKELAQLNAFHQDLVLVEEQLETAKNRVAEGREKASRYEVLKEGFREIKQYVFQTLLGELSIKATSLASELFELPIAIKFLNAGDDGLITKINTLVRLDGQERSLGLFSGGQYRRIELAVDLALASIVARRSLNPINFRILDEPFKDLSEASMQKVVKLLERLEGSTIIIEHNSVTKSIIHNTFEIEYRNGVSHNAAQALEMPKMRKRA